jgi:VanZ family protein
LYTTSRYRAIAWGFLAIAILVNIGGYGLNLYERFNWFDDVTHAYTSFAITLLLALLLYGDMLAGVRKSPILLILTVASLGVALGALWEIAEWGYDQMTPTNDILGKRDTMIDLILDTLGAVVAGFVSVEMVEETK